VSTRVPDSPSSTSDFPVDWPIGDEIWRQTGPAHFVPLSRRGATVAPTLADFAFVLGARADGERFFPAAFNVNPDTGARLTKVVADPRATWLPPYGAGSASRLVGTASSAVEETSAEQGIQAILAAHADSPAFEAGKREVALPQQSGLNFVVANLGGYCETLFAISRAGDIFLWDRVADGWLRLRPEADPLGPFSGEAHAWSAALLASRPGNDLLLAVDAGAVRIKIDPVGLRYRIDRHAGVAVGGATSAAGAGYVPLRRAGGLAIAISSPEGIWSEIEVADSANVDDTLSAALHDETASRVLWVGRDGYLSLTLRTDTRSAQWHPWPVGAEGRPDLGPPFRDGSGLWQLLKQTDGGRFFYTNLSSSLPETHTVDGARLGTGRSSFRFDVALDRPWDAIDPDLHGTPKEVVYPFGELPRAGLVLQVSAPKPRGSLQSFFDNDEPVDASFGIGLLRGGERSILIHAARPWQAQWFFFDGSLWLYIDSVSRLFRWSAS
jgi:hypothetical protein